MRSGAWKQKKVFPGSAIFRLHLRLSVDRKWPIIFWFSSLDKPTYWGPQLPNEPFWRITIRRSHLNCIGRHGVVILFLLSPSQQKHEDKSSASNLLFRWISCFCIKIVSVKNGVDSVSISAVENCQQQKCTILRV